MSEMEQKLSAEGRERFSEQETSRSEGMPETEGAQGSAGEAGPGEDEGIPQPRSERMEETEQAQAPEAEGEQGQPVGEAGPGEREGFSEEGASRSEGMSGSEEEQAPSVGRGRSSEGEF